MIAAIGKLPKLGALKVEGSRVVIVPGIKGPQ
jgi:hypothetical protein